MTTTHTTKRTTPATPILKWDAEALNHLADLKFKAEEAEAVLEFACQALREVQDDSDSDTYDIDMALNDAMEATRAKIKAQAKFESFCLNYRV